MTSPPPRSGDVETLGRARRAPSLERRLPLLMTAPLLAVLATSLFVTYRTLTDSAQEATRERLERAAQQVSKTVEEANDGRAARYRPVASDPAVRAALLGGDTGAARRAMQTLASEAGDAGLAVELLDGANRVVARVGAEATPADRGHIPAWPVPGIAPRPDSIGFGRIYLAADRSFFWGVTPVVGDDGSVIGRIAFQRRIGGPRDARQLLGNLVGADVAILMRNVGDGVAAGARGVPTPAPTRVRADEDGVLHERPGTGLLIAVTAPITATPWETVLESPLRPVLARSRQTTARLALLSALLAALGAAVCWLISRRITRPLADLTHAAEAIARGEAAGRVRSGKGDEVGRLAASFNQMATEVTLSRRELERRVVDAQSAATALEEANAKLQQAIEEADRARADAERANRAKSDFLAVMSHELRTPLNAIGGYTQLLDLGIYGPISDPQRDTLARIERSQSHLLRLINDVLNFARIDAGQVRYDIEDVEVDDALAGLESLVAPQMQAKGLALEYRRNAPSPVARADVERLQQIVLNLLTNAVKFTPAGGRVVLECEPDGDLVLIRVRDTGVGIPAERQPTIFEPFVQGHRALNRPNEGVGLGLSISRDLARGMGGELTVESREGVGSTFTLALPRGGLRLVRAGPASDQRATSLRS